MAYPGSHFKNFTAQEVSFSIRGKEDLYYAAIRNDYFLPKFSASIISEDYITHKEALKIFGKSYVPPPRNVKIDEKPIVSLPDDFVQGLPASKTKNKGIRLGLLSTSKA